MHVWRKEATERNRIQGSQLYILRCERQFRCLRLLIECHPSAAKLWRHWLCIKWSWKTCRTKGGRPLQATACMRHLIAFQQNLLLEIIYRNSFWVSWPNILNHTEVHELLSLIFTQWNKNFQTPPPTVQFKRYLAISKKKTNSFLLWSTISIAPYFGNLMWPGRTFVIGSFFRGNMENASHLLLRETLY